VEKQLAGPQPGECQPGRKPATATYSTNPDHRSRLQTLRFTATRRLHTGLPHHGSAWDHHRCHSSTTCRTCHLPVPATHTYLGLPYPACTCSSQTARLPFCQTDAHTTILRYTQTPATPLRNYQLQKDLQTTVEGLSSPPPHHHTTFPPRLRNVLPYRTYATRVTLRTRARHARGLVRTPRD